MSDIYSNDDDLFEDYVEEKPHADHYQDSNPDNPINSVFGDEDSPFKSLLRNSALKVNFGEAFYRAATEWMSQGYREANNASIINELVRITNGEFLYRHRLMFCAETIARKKTIINFLSVIVDGENTDTLIRSANEDFQINFTKNYFNMFFKSFYNIHLHTFYHEVALYKTLCEITNTPVDQSLIDLETESNPLLDSSSFINDLYMQYFEKEEIKTILERHLEETFSQNK